MNNKMHVKTGDMVVVLSGKDVKKKGKVLSVIPKTGKVIVEGVAMVTKHKKPRKQGDPGGIITQESAVYASKVMHICGKCSMPTRIARRVREDGVIVRMCKKCGEEL